MNLLTISPVGAFIFALYLLVVMFILRTLAAKYHDKPWAQGLAALVA